MSAAMLLCFVSVFAHERRLNNILIAFFQFLRAITSAVVRYRHRNVVEIVGYGRTGALLVEIAEYVNESVSDT